MKAKVDYTIYLVTDRALMTTNTVEESVELAIKGGCTLVQLREKELNSRAFYDTAKRVHEVTKRYNIPLIINDRVDIALAINAEGVHVGQSDLPADKVRELIGEDKIVGVSAGTIKEAQKAKEDGADYLGVGAMYATSTKEDAEITTESELIKIQELGLPIVVIGGVGKANAKKFAQLSVNGLAVVSAIVAQENIEKATAELKEEFLKGV